MAVHLRLLLVVTGLTAAGRQVTTVSRVSVMDGGSIIIPCRYASKYRDNVKYLCKSEDWRSCKPVVKTNRPDSSGKYLISDDQSQRIVRFTINHLTSTDTYYWCVVEIDDWADDGHLFHLSVTHSSLVLYVDEQQVTGFIGHSLTIKCHYTTTGDEKWCRLGGGCVTRESGMGGTIGTLNSSVPGVFTVTMDGLSTGSGGWYMCVKDDWQMPVFVTVTEKPTTTVATTVVSSQTPSTEPTTRSQEQNSTTSVDLKLYIIPLCVLIVIVLVTVFIWCMLKKNRQSKTQSPPDPTVEEEATYSKVDKKKRTADVQEDATYSNIHFKTSDQGAAAGSDVDMYTTVTIREHPTIKRAEVPDVTYSTLMLPHPNK